MATKDEVTEMIEAAGGQVREVTQLPDGSGGGLCGCYTPDGLTGTGKAWANPRETRQPPRLATKMTGVEMIAAERERQVRVEGWTPQHDAQHNNGDMVLAAIAYARVSMWMTKGETFPIAERDAFHTAWPWDASWWKPSVDLKRNLVKAGALIAAEIDRLEARELAGRV